MNNTLCGVKFRRHLFSLNRDIIVDWLIFFLPLNHFWVARITHALKGLWDLGPPKNGFIRGKNSTQKVHVK